MKGSLLLRWVILIAIMGRKHARKTKGDGRKTAGSTSRGGRTLQSEVCRTTIAGTSSARAVATTTVGPVCQMPQNCYTSHNQVGVLIAKCLPLTHVDCFKSAFKDECEAGLKSNYSWSPDIPTVVKTPVSWINSALISTFGGNCVSLEQCSADANEVFGQNEMVGNSYLGLLLMDCMCED